jgi:hypothetical protein
MLYYCSVHSMLEVRISCDLLTASLLMLSFWRLQRDANIPLGSTP